MSEIERLNVAIESAPKVALRDLIEQVSIRAGFQVNEVAGVDINKEFIVSRANLKDSDTSKYKVVPNNHFACNLMHIGRDIKLPVALNHYGRDLYVSPAYYVFHVTNSELLSQYLYIELNRFEFDRLTWFNTDSSVRGNLKEERFLDMKIPLPPIEVQQRYVDAYVGLQKLAEENEALLEPLSKACQAYLAEMKNRYPMVQLKDYIEELKQTNSLGKYDESDAKGVNTQKQMQSCKRLGENLSSYKIVPPDSIVYNANIKLSSQGEKFAVAKYSGARPCIVTNFYVVLRIKENRQSTLLLDYLFLFLIREDFARYIKFISCSSVRDRFDFNNMCEVCIPLPPIEVQQSIVALHRCAEEARSIAAKARETLNSICPAMIQRASHEMH